MSVPYFENKKWKYRSLNSDSFLKSQNSDDNLAALPELGQGAQPGSKKLQPGFLRSRQ